MENSCIFTESIGRGRATNYLVQQYVSRAHSIARGDARKDQEKRSRVVQKMRDENRSSPRQRTREFHEKHNASPHRRSYHERARRSPYGYGRAHYGRGRAPQRRDFTPRSPPAPTRAPIYPHFNDDFGRAFDLPDFRQLGPVVKIGGLPLDASSHTPTPGAHINVLNEFPNMVFKAGKRDIQAERVQVRSDPVNRKIKPSPPLDRTCSTMASEVIEMAYRDSLIHKQGGWPVPSREHALQAIQNIPARLGPLRLVSDLLTLSNPGSVDTYLYNLFYF